MIFMSNQHLCLYPNELKFEPTICQLINHLMNYQMSYLVQLINTYQPGH